MRIRTALILCAGFGKRLNPLTLETPKPLLKIKDTTILENCINVISKLGIKKILINTFHLGDQISEFIKMKNFEVDIKIKEDGKNILVRIIILFILVVKFSIKVCLKITF